MEPKTTNTHQAKISWRSYKLLNKWFPHSQKVSIIKSWPLSFLLFQKVEFQLSTHPFCTDSFKKGKRADSIFPIYFQQPGTRTLGSPSCCWGDDHCQVTIDMKKEKSKKSSPLSFKFPGWVSFYWIPPLSPSPPWPSSTPWRDYALLPPTSPPAPTSPSATHFPGVLFRLTLNLNSPFLQQRDISWKMFKN